MPKPSNRADMVKHGLRLVHERGFAASSVRDIAEATQAPHGSFISHFGSKEAFGLELIEAYHDMTSAAVTATLRNDQLAPLVRLHAWMTNQLNYLRLNEMRRGCLYGNMALEMSEHSEPIRARVTEIFAENRASVRYCLDAAVAAGEIAKDTPTAELAGFIVSSLQGAILVAKADRDPAPVQRFIKMLYAAVLRAEEPKSPKIKPKTATKKRSRRK